MILSAVAKGLLRSWQIKKILLIFWLLNLLVALLFSRPYLNAFQEFFSHRLAGDILAKFNIYTFYAEFYHFMKPAVQTAKQTVLLGGFVHFILTIGLGGGLVYYFIHWEKVAVGRFWLECGRYVGRMFRLVLFTAVLLLLGLFAGIFVPQPFTYFLPEPFVENIYFYFYAAWLLLLGSIFLLVFLVVDITRIFLVHDDAKSLTQTVSKSFRFFIKMPIRTFIVYLALYIPALLVLLFYWWMQKYIPDTQVGGIVVGFVLLQLFIYLQLWIKFSRYGALVWLIQNS